MKHTVGLSIRIPVSLMVLLVWAPRVYPAPPGTIPSHQNDVTAEERALLAENHLKGKLQAWQRHLKLQDWRISIRMCPPGELKPRTVGNIHWDAKQRSAVIRVLDTRHYKLPYQEMLNDMELTVVHELVHLQLSSLPRTEATRGAEELVVNRIAEALVALDRRRP